KCGRGYFEEHWENGDSSSSKGFAGLFLGASTIVAVGLSEPEMIETLAVREGPTLATRQQRVSQKLNWFMKDEQQMVMHIGSREDRFVKELVDVWLIYPPAPEGVCNSYSHTE
ncbi:hypothetical protein EJB05_42208, partial [Eragrostis curvula]